MSTESLKRATSASEVGVSSAAVQALVEDMLGRGVDVHSFMLLRHGEVACESWRAPLNADMTHMVFSVSKSFFSTAFGFAVSEGYITPETRFLDVFPELRPKKKDERLEKLTLFHLISMTSGKRAVSVKRSGPDWLRGFVESPWDFTPGEQWRYVSANYHAAACALTKLTGMSITEYLTPRLYEPLGIETPFWETSPSGVECGGWGLMLKIEDIAKLILCYHNGGMYNGVQVIPREWATEAVKKQNDNSDTQRKPDSQAGYGYGFWRCAGANAFRCEGVYSQYAISLEDYDACLVMTSSHADMQETIDIIWEHLPSLFIEEKPVADGEEKRFVIPPYENPEVSVRSETEKLINGKVYKMKRKLFLNIIKIPVCVFPMPLVFFAKESGGNMDDLCFCFDEDGLTFEWTEVNGRYRNKISASMSGGRSDSKITIGELCLNVKSYAFWNEDGTLELHIHPVEGVAKRRFIFKFKGKSISMYPDAVPGFDEKAKNIGDTLKCVLVGRYFHTWIDILVPRVKNMLQPWHHGRW